MSYTIAKNRITNTLTAVVAAASVLLGTTALPVLGAYNGDVNGSGAPDTTDARLILQYRAGKLGEGAIDLDAADANGDGKVDTTDARLVLQHGAGKIKLPRCNWAFDLPRMDGSTSTIPLEAGIRAALFDISQEEAEHQVKHTTTYGSYENLVDGKCDLIFSVPLSQGQIDEAKEKGKTLEMEKIAAEGFVFVVNAKNPVDTLTQQQLRDIYSGKITNWKEVGGNDAAIVAYQRNETSGSQNFMHTFMGDTPLMEPITTFLPSSMGSLMDAIAVYDNAENAIGYSVYAYAADMYGNGNEIKFIKVDGVAPTKATMAAGEYPLLGFNYAVYDAASPADSSLRKMVAWLVTEDGQRAIQAAGYIPIMPLGAPEEATIERYTAVGTGPEKPDSYTPSLVWYVPMLPDSSFPGVWESERVLNCLTDSALQAQIRNFIEKTNSTYVTLQCINGYLSVQVRVFGEEPTSRTALYDLVTGREIAYTDLFFKGEDFVPALNETLFAEFEGYTMNASEAIAYELKRKFAGLEAGHTDFTLTEVVYDSSSPYTDYASVATRGVYTMSVLSQPRDLTGIFKDGVEIVAVPAWESTYVNHEPLLTRDRDANLLSSAHYDPDVCAAVNARIRAICETELSDAAVDAFCGKNFSDSENAELRIYLLGGRYFCVSGGYDYLFYEDESGWEEWDHIRVAHLFDPATGEELPYTALLREGWQEAATWYRNDQHINTFIYYDLGLYENSGFDDSLLYGTRTEIEAPDLTGYRLSDIREMRGGIGFVFDRGGEERDCVCAIVPVEYLN